MEASNPAAGRPGPRWATGRRLLIAAATAPVVALAALVVPGPPAYAGVVGGPAVRSVAAAGASVPSDAVWSSSDKWATWSNGGYTVANDVWGSGAGPQTVWARTGTNWGVVTSQPTGGVKSYPHTGRTLNRSLSSLRGRSIYT